MSQDHYDAKLSGSVQKSDFYAALADRAADQLEGVAKETDRRSKDLAVADRYRLLAREARQLSAEFRTWLSTDPGTQTRIRATTRLMDLRAAADAAVRAKKR